MAKYWMLAALCLASWPAYALDTRERVSSHGAASRLLSNHPIVVGTSGFVPIPYESAVRIFESASLLADIQSEYARLLPPGEKPEFQITQIESNRYYYVNRSGQETWIDEIHRGHHEGPSTEVVFYARGTRFFGPFEALIHIGAGPDGEGSAYRVRVFAYPENSVSRFLARHLRIVELFFRSKTAEIEKLAVKIGQALAARGSEWQQADIRPVR
ncbi:MAG: hypothetical protein NZ740_06780 [Kiritimatiellae bacterium]|nr:hypothetical protein [Kiritimatiellia bacterium]MDW8458801.1 hypothetical protein [Verrucomicrobiota bacterium]